MADYNSEFTGEQMDAVFRQITNMYVGHVDVRGVMNGYGVETLTFPESGFEGVILAGIRTVTGDAGDGINAAVESGDNGGMVVSIRGDGVQAGMVYRVDLLLIPEAE